MTTLAASPAVILADTDGTPIGPDLRSLDLSCQRVAARFTDGIRDAVMCALYTSAAREAAQRMADEHQSNQLPLLLWKLAEAYAVQWEDTTHAAYAAMWADPDDLGRQHPAG